MKRISALLAAVLLFLAPLAQIDAYASSPTDEILNYFIQADVNEDATVILQYHIDWLVLDDDELGPLDWVTVGIPNSNYVDYGALSDNIRSIAYDGNNMLRIDFDRSYYEDEVVSFDYYVIGDYMYSMNALKDGYTTFYFTPGWFDGIEVDDLTVYWNNTALETWSGNCTIENGYNVWTTSLDPGEKFDITVSYPNDAFSFDESKDWSNSGSYDYDYDDGGSDPIAILLGAIIFFGPQILILRVIIRSIKAFRAKSGFTANNTTKKVKRTKVIYYSECPGCGAPREEGKESCQFCGRSLIKSEEVLEEKEIKNEDKEALKYKTNGVYHYSSNPDTFVRVNVVNIPVAPPRPSSPRSSGSSTLRSGSGGSRRSGGGGCAHSSCACACASCACACACACAGGGRAGCSTKDFYNTNLKLRQLELANKKKK